MKVRRLTVLALLICAAAAHAADSPATTTLPADFAARMQALRQGLASSEFSQREAAQRELEKISPSQLELLQVVAGAERDPEIKARLAARISEMQLYPFLHPAPISLKVDNAPLRDVAAALQAQVKGAVTLQSDTTFGARAGNDDRKVTLNAEKQPFWQIFQEINRQHPLTITPSLNAVTGETILRLQNATPANARTVTPLGDAFACVANINGQPAAGNWSLWLTFYADPRIRVIQYAPLQIDKIIDQEGRSVLPSLIAASEAQNLNRPAINWTSTAVLSPVPGLKKLAEVKGKVKITLLEREKTSVLDLTQAQVEPLQTPRGQISYHAAGGNIVLRLTPPPADRQLAGAARMPLSIRILDANGVVVNGYTATSPSLSINLPVGRAAKVEVTWPETSREYVLPFQVTDVDINHQPPGGGARGGVLAAN